MGKIDIGMFSFRSTLPGGELTIFLFSLCLAISTILNSDMTRTELTTLSEKIRLRSQYESSSPAVPPWSCTSPAAAPASAAFPPAPPASWPRRWRLHAGTASQA